MNVYEAIHVRKSVRDYLTKEVPGEVLDRVLEAARLAPSANNRQEWRFIVVQGRAMREKLAAAALSQRFVGEAPIVLVCCAETDEHVMRCGQMSYPIDLAIAIDHITLAAVEEGLGTCWIGAFEEQAVQSLLGIPESIRVVALLPIGYPAEPGATKKSRLPMDRLVRRERWNA